MRRRIIDFISLVTVVLLAVFGFNGCTPKPENIVVTAMFSKNILELPIMGTLQNAPGRYYIDADMEEIFATISLDNSLSAELIDGMIYVCKDNGDSTKDYFLIREIYGTTGNKMYEFFDTGGLIKLGSAYMRILIPYHLIDIDWDTAYFDIETKYNTKYCLDSFFEFYNSSGWYDIEKGADYIVINGYIDEARILALNNSLKVPLKHMEFGLPIKMQFTGDNTGINAFIISLIAK